MYTTFRLKGMTMEINEQKKKRLRADILLITGLLLLSGALFLYRAMNREKGAVAVLYVDGVRTEAYPLSQDREIRIDSRDGTSYNILVISHGRADVTEAGCPDGTCVNMHPISHSGETIICLPNRLVVQIEGESASGVDVIS